jgi:hypothetical protein
MQRTIQKRIEAAFIEPMQCKPVTALPAGEKWIFELKLDGYRCIAVKREKEVTLLLAPREGAHQAFPWNRLGSLPRSKAISFSMENSSLWIRKANLRFTFFRTLFHSRFRSIFTPSIYCTEMASFW